MSFLSATVGNRSRRKRWVEFGKIGKLCTRRFGWLICLTVSAALFSVLFSPSHSRAFEVGNSKWPTASTLFYVDFQGPDGALWNAAFEEAMDKWSSATIFDFKIEEGVSVDPCQDPNDYSPKNGVKFDSMMCDEEWGSGVLAVEMSWFSGLPFNRKTVQSGIAFNDNVEWDVYSGPLDYEIFDFRRVAVHELGHTIGLAHEDDVPSIMGTYVGDYGDPQPDDIAGVAYLYRNVPAAGICCSRKIQATGVLFANLSKCYSREVSYADRYDLDYWVDVSESKFEDAWDNAEAKAVRDGEDCFSSSMLSISGQVLTSVEDGYSRIVSSVNPQDKRARKLCSALIGYVGKLGKDLFQAESKHARRAGFDLQTAKDEAIARFRNRWEKMVSWADPQGTVYTLPSTEEIETDIDVLVNSVCADMGE